MTGAKGSVPIYLTVDYRGDACFGGDYRLAYQLCQEFQSANLAARLVDINEPLYTLLQSLDAGVFFVLADSFWCESVNAHHYPQTFGLRKALSEAGQAYIGSDYEAVRRSSSGNKTAARQRLQGRVALPKGIEIELTRSDQSIVDAVHRSLGLPMVLKQPINSGFSEAVHYVDDEATLLRRVDQYREADRPRLLCEEFIDGVEYSTWVLERRGRPYCYGSLYISEAARTPILTMAKKRLEGTYEIASGHELKAIEHAAIAAHRALALRHYSRTDIIVRGGTAYVIDVNARPKLSHASLGYVANARGDTIVDAVAGLIEDAAQCLQAA